MDQNEVTSAFDIVLEEIANAITVLNEQVAQAAQCGKYDIAKDLIEKASQMTAFRTKVGDLQKEWLNMFASVSPPKAQKIRRKVAARLERGRATPQEAFRIPILQSLIELGGSAAASDVLDKVEEKMRNQLNAYDLSPMPSNPAVIRWRNKAQWARYTMVRQGLMASNSPYGVWEITEAGKRWLLAVTAQKQ